jgi:hypothetical protein
MMRQRLWLALLVLSATLTHCSNCKENVIPEGSLPPETLTGAGTFGCKINGSDWVASRVGFFAATKATYDPTYKDGTFTLTANTFKKNVDTFDYFNISITSFNKTGTYSFLDNANINFHRETTGCEYVLQHPSVIPVISGSINIKKVDVNSRIIAGTFECITHVKDCDTLKITDGRFDVKF